MRQCGERLQGVLLHSRQASHGASPPRPPNDNALIPRSYQFDSYLAGESKDLSLLETIVYGYKVDFACLTAQFGANLRRSLFEPRERLPIEAVTR